MALITADFEETEYRGPLYNQLGKKTNLIWEPGQVFEGHIGIDVSFNISRGAFWGFINTAVPSGVYLPRYNFDFIWKARKRKKKLPSFKLNLFIQAKRPQFGKVPPKKLKVQGLGKPYWRFETTPHQQKALENLRKLCKGRAVVSYACPAFHKQSDLYKHTVNGSIIENCTFPDVDILAGHSAWNYSQPGASGVRNSIPSFAEDVGLIKRLEQVVGEFRGESDEEEVNVADQLKQLGNLCEQIAKADESSFEAALFAQAYSVWEDILDDLKGNEYEAALGYVKVKMFCEIFKLDWTVLGS